MAENPTKGGVHHSAFLSRKTAPAAPLFHVRGAKVVKNRAENQPINISSHSAKNRSPTPKSPRIPHVTGDCVRRRSNNLLGQFRKITTDFRRTFSHKIPLVSHNHLFQQLLVSRKMISFCLLCTRLFSYHQMNYTISPVSTGLNKLFLIFFLKTGVTFPFFSSLIYETRLVAVAERHTRSDCGLYLLDTIYIYIYVSNLSGHPSWCPSLRFYHPIYPFQFDF